MESLNSEPLAQTNKNVPGGEGALSKSDEKGFNESGIPMSNILFSCHLLHYPCCFPSMLFLLQTTQHDNHLYYWELFLNVISDSLPCSVGTQQALVEFPLRGTSVPFPTAPIDGAQLVLFQRSKSPAPTSADLLSAQQRGGRTTNRGMLWHKQQPRRLAASTPEPSSPRQHADIFSTITTFANQVKAPLWQLVLQQDPTFPFTAQLHTLLFQFWSSHQ